LCSEPIYFQGADVNVEAVAGMTALHSVSIRGTPEIARLLVSRGNANARAQNGSTPLDISRRKVRLDLVRIMNKEGD
jgi:ankyrin repeat protein